MADPRAEYRRRLAHWDAEIARGDRRHATFANLRLADLMAAIVMAVAAFQHAFSWWWLVLPALVLTGLAIAHARALRALEESRRARQLYVRGLSRVDGTWAGNGPDGTRFGEGHPFALDLDLFGSGSLFQLLSTARTEVGEETLAVWLTTGADVGEVRTRQAAVAELRDLIDFREGMAVTASEVSVAKTTKLREWSAAPAAGFTVAARVVFGACTLLSAVVVAAFIKNPLLFPELLLWGLLMSAVAFVWVRASAAALSGVDKATTDLVLLRMLLERIEAQKFSSPRLIALGRSLPTDGVRASQAIRRLERLVATLDSCRNQIFLPIAVMFLIPSHLAVAIDGWRATHGRSVAAWLEAVGDCEALSALATFAFEHPSDPFPEIADDGRVFDAAGLGHPLIHAPAAVVNDVRLGGDGPRMLMVSGSNMSGKSTMLRTVGVNIVLALAGAPVRAARLRLSRLVPGTALRVDDSLQEGHSRFYAEILRIRSIVELARGSVPVLFLLDEILAGTNSYDRRIGAEAIIRTLVQVGAIGMVTTHDLALTELVSSLGVPAANVHFEDRLEDGRMIFDYRMRPGVVEHSNALALMRAVGLDV